MEENKLRWSVVIYCDAADDDVCLRLMLMNSVEQAQLWNVFNQVTLHSQDVRHHRFCLRLMLKNPENHALCLLNGHTSLVSGTFKHALGRSAEIQSYQTQIVRTPHMCMFMRTILVNFG